MNTLLINKSTKSSGLIIWAELPQDPIDKAILAFRKRLRACVNADGGHFEHKLFAPTIRANEALSHLHDILVRNKCSMHTYIHSDIFLLNAKRNFIS